MKLFRKIRQTLIKEGNLKRYLLYALGEILLVMIGISLAFQVNNWNDNRIKGNAEISYYENIRDQITDDGRLIHTQIDFNNKYTTQFKYAYEILESDDRSRIDTLGLIVRNLLEYSDFDRQGNIYETMVNSGEVKLLRNHDIINGIRLLEEKYLYLNRMENIHYDAMISHVITAVNPVLKFSDGKIQKPDLVYTYEFQNLVLSLLKVMEEKDKVYHEALHEIEVITGLIDKELHN
ncbi:DUF6090 family protein [Maribacter sp. HTCC2170]|uniref:DUF6090 family protein n=1 Tax=Maribacter sp. (strain HTCC2170 / KCCM 42371) TaxID=313603 RepID=UPI00006B4736|nr:DUF6090 family protein [Maribacter sp. HTCC2170]EAR01697.1 hypothetical protein FB2170_14253 [Maribacter sp. HTCC2170]